MLEVTGGRWPKNVPIPRAAGEDFFTSRMARDLKVFPYGAEYCCCCVGSDGEGPSRRCAETPGGCQDRGSYARGEKGAGSAKAAASGGSEPVPAAKPAAPGHSKAAASAKAAAPGGSKPPSGRLGKGRRPLSPARRIADFGTDISVEDYLGVGAAVVLGVGPCLEVGRPW
jgi:hypothetical protein